MPAQSYRTQLPVMDRSDSRVQLKDIGLDPVALEAVAQLSAGPAAARFASPLPATTGMEDQEDGEEGDGEASEGLSEAGTNSFTSDSASLTTRGAEVSARQAEETATLTVGPAEGAGCKRVSDFMREQDRFMPIANIGKIMARQLAYTGHAKISEDTKRLMQECATEFICFIMSDANDQAAQAKRKAVSGQDIINACAHMGARAPD